MAKKGTEVSRFSLDRAGLALEFNPAGVADRLLNYGEKRCAAARDFYSDFYEMGAQALGPTRVRQFHEIVRVMEALGYPQDEQDWLDVGTGNGHFPQYLSDRLSARVNVWAIDPSLPEETRHFKRLGLEQLPHASLPKQFGILSFLDVFEHFDDPKKALKKTLEILGDGGLLVIKVPNKDSLMYRVSRQLRGVLPGFSRSIMKRLYQVDYPPPHYFYYDDSSLRST